jgi:hypothetical protein
MKRRPADLEHRRGAYHPKGCLPMATTSIVEQLHIHLAVCRARRAGLVCSTCSELVERAARYVAPSTTTITRACGHEVRVVLSSDPQRAATEIEQLVTGDCGPCVKARRAAQRTTLWSEVR